MVIPKPSRAMLATRRPMVPTPRMPSVEPLSSVRLSAIGRAAFQPSPRRLASSRESGRRRCISADMTYSATALVLLPGRLATAMPRAVAAATGMKSRPTPWRTIALRRGAWSTMSSGNFARTMIPSAFAAHRRSVSGCASGAVINLACGSRIASPSGCMALVRRTMGLSGIGGGPFDNRIDETAELFHLDLEGGAGLEPGRRLVHPCHAGRCARGDDITGFERLLGGKKTDEIGDAEQHVPGRARLHDAAVDLQRDAERVRIGHLVA